MMSTARIKGNATYKMVLLLLLQLTLRPSSALPQMSGKFAFAAFVAVLFAHSRFMAVQAQAHLQPRDTLPTQNNSTQDHILPRDDLDSTFFANTSAPGAKSKRTLVAEDAKVDCPFPLLLLHTLTAESYSPPSCT